MSDVALRVDLCLSPHPKLLEDIGCAQGLQSCVIESTFGLFNVGLRIVELLFINKHSGSDVMILNSPTCQSKRETTGIVRVSTLAWNDGRLEGLQSSASEEFPVFVLISMCSTFTSSDLILQTRAGRDQERPTAG